VLTGNYEIGVQKAITGTWCIYTIFI